MVWKTDPGNRVGEGGADAVQSGREHARPMASEGIYSLPHLPEVSLSAVSVTSNQPQSKNIKWKIPEVNNSYILNCGLSSVMKSHAFRLHPKKRPFAQRILPVNHLEALLVIRLPVLVSQCLRSRNPYFT